MVDTRQIDGTLDKFDLRLKEIRNIDLKRLHAQARPNYPLDDLFTQPAMLGSPHFEVADIYVNGGSKLLRSIFKDTRYYKMLQRFGKKPSADKIIRLVNSLRKGYLRKPYESSYIIALDEPFAYSRYGREVPWLVPEIFSGHHRCGGLIGLGNDHVKIVVAEDANPGSCYSSGKIHDLCKEY